MKSDYPNGSGFTLLELLVVLGIVAILASLLLPAIARSKHKAQLIRCKGNLHQMGIGLQNFVGDNHAYPSIVGPTNSENPGLWVSQLASGGFGVCKPVTNLIDEGVWRCPSAPDYLPFPNEDAIASSYGYNVYGVLPVGDATNALGLHGSFVPGARGFAPVRESEVAAPADMMAIGDSIIGGLTFDRWDMRPNYRARAMARHQGRVNVMFCDGHVESPTLHFVFEETSDAALTRWNRDHQSHRERLSGTP